MRIHPHAKHGMDILQGFGAGNTSLCLVQLYTSGSTGKPKGVEHTLAGYMIGASTTFKYVFDHRAEDIYWCTADCGWITGHSYVAYGMTRPCLWLRSPA